MNLDEEVKNIEAHSGATSFISKLWFLLSQPQEFGEYIRWTVKGKGFILSHSMLMRHFGLSWEETEDLSFRFTDIWRSDLVEVLQTFERRLFPVGP